MAEFVQTMKDWQRMCASMKGGIAKCDNCPLLKVLCQYKPNEEADFAGAEQIIEKWVEEHPVVYPTWEEWLVDNGVFASDDVRFHGDYRLYMDGRPMCNIPTEKIYSQIPADIAQKLGIEPKEG